MHGMYAGPRGEEASQYLIQNAFREELTHSPRLPLKASTSWKAKINTVGTKLGVILIL